MSGSRILLGLLCITLFVSCVQRRPSRRTCQGSLGCIEDSICKYGEQRHDRPKRLKINFPAKKVSDAYKIRELHRALPEEYRDEKHEYNYLYSYYFLNRIHDYDEVGDSMFYPKGDVLRYKLKDVYVLDINGDGLPDLLHYPKYYRAVMFDVEFYDVFIRNNNNTYKIVRFGGYITKAVFTDSGLLDTLETFRGPCCDDDHNFFYQYAFDRNKNDLVLIKADTVLTCQFRSKDKP